MKRLLRHFVFYLCYLYYLLLVKTVKAKLIGNESLQKSFAEGKNVVFCSPHHFLLGLFVGVDAGKLNRPIVSLIVSLSQDGELISNILKKRRFELIRGSSNRGGQKALLQMKRAGREGKSLGLAYDGPKGPPLIPKRGLLGCARAVDGPLFLTYGFAKPFKYLPFLKPFLVGSWDRFLIPVPFCSLEVYFEKIPEKEELHIKSDTEYEFYVMDYIEKRGLDIYGNLYSKS